MGRGPPDRPRRNAPYSRWWLCKGAAPGSVQIRSYRSPLVLHCRLAVQLDLDKDWSVGREESGDAGMLRPFPKGRSASSPASR